MGRAGRPSGWRWPLLGHLRAAGLAKAAGEWVKVTLTPEVSPTWPSPTGAATRAATRDADPHKALCGTCAARAARTHATRQRLHVKGSPARARHGRAGALPHQSELGSAPDRRRSSRTRPSRARLSDPPSGASGSTGAITLALAEPSSGRQGSSTSGTIWDAAQSAVGRSAGWKVGKLATPVCGARPRGHGAQPLWGRLVGSKAAKTGRFQAPLPQGHLPA